MTKSSNATTCRNNRKEVAATPENFPHQGEIFYVNRGTTGSTGSEQWSDRYAVILSCNQFNRTSPIVVVAYITTRNKRALSINVDISLPRKHRVVLCDQIYAVDKSRLEQCTGTVTEQQLKQIKKVLSKFYDLEERSA